MTILKDYIGQILSEKWHSAIQNEDVFINPSSRELAKTVRLAKKMSGWGEPDIRGLIDRATGDLYIWLGYDVMHKNAMRKIVLDDPITIYITGSTVKISQTTSWFLEPGQIEEYVEFVSNNKNLARMMGQFQVTVKG